MSSAGRSSASVGPIHIRVRLDRYRVSQELRRLSDETKRVASVHGARTVRVFGSTARGEEGPGSDFDSLVEMGDRRGLLEEAALPGDLEKLLGCRVQIVTVTGSAYAREDVREQIEREAISL